MAATKPTSAPQTFRCISTIIAKTMLFNEGFLRFRGAEDCNTDYCMYRDQKTTHFHCNRSSCQFTFKNKADMEKHKNYHMKDEQLNKDGFKKFMKHEPCGF